MTRVLITGITGAVGSSLAPRLARDGHELRALVRHDPAELAAAGRPLPRWVEPALGDVSTGAGVARALSGVEVAFYLVHSMEPAAAGSANLLERERRAATMFGRLARAADVRRIVYLGGLVPAAGAASVHLRSRLEVERTLCAAVPGSLALRASIVIGARSRSFRFLVRLIERMPVLLVPAWRDHRTAPVDQRDLTECLARAVSAELGSGEQSLDVAGPETVRYGELLARIREALLIERPVLNLPGIALTPIASRISALIAGETQALIGPLMAGLDVDLLPREPTAAERFGIRRHSLDAAIEHALGEWEADEPLRAR